MSSPALRITGAALLVVLAMWAGAKYRHSHTAAHGSAGVPVAAGMASVANPSDSTLNPSDPAEGALPPMKIPDRLPDFSLADRNGKSTPIRSFDGKSLIINFWATWCAPCRSEIPLLGRLHAEWQPQGMSVIGIAVDHRDEVVKFADRYKIAYPLLIGEQDALDVATAFGVETPAFPFTVFTDQRGEVVALFVGELHKPQAELILGEVQSLNRGLIDLRAARQAIAEGLRTLTLKVGGAA